MYRYVKIQAFITSVNANQATAATVSSIVPKGHHEEFRPPAGLNIPKVEEPQKSALKGRQSIYTIAPTPPRKPKQADEKPVYKFPISRKALPKGLHTRIMSSSKTDKTQNKTLSDGVKRPLSSPSKSSIVKVVARNIVKSFDSVKSTSKIPYAQLPSRANLKPRPLKMPSPPPKVPSTTSKVAAPHLKKTLESVKSTNKISSTRENLKAKALKMPPPLPPQNPSTTDAVKQRGAAGKVRNISSKRTENVKQTKKATVKSGDARLAQNLKAKKSSNNSKKSHPIIQVNAKELLTLCNNNNQEMQDMVIQTPKDFATLNPFEEFVTSTKLRTSAHNLEEAKGIGLTDNTRPHSNSSVKRNIMQHAKNTDEKEVEGLNKVKKYNFLISETGENNVECKQNAIETEEKFQLQSEGNNVSSNSRESKSEEITPTKYGPDEKPSNYLSPFVSVARGKVSLREEVEKRNSIYMQSEVPIDTLNPSNSSKSSVEVRRTLEAVRYFRQQLQAEIDRLHKFCDIWENYKAENLEKIQNANGEDMINVTIGQTRLLTSKKFMQFKGLIDRCESGATGIGAVDCDGSEDTKPITSIDLEGFWSMLKLQVDNLDKRFETLNRWKSNDWVDPDEVKPKLKKVLSKVKKAKKTNDKPNSRLQQIMRKMHAEIRKNKINGGDASPNVILLTQKQRRSGISNSSTPRKSTDNSLTSRHMSIVVKDRKYFSPAATVISIPNPLQRTNSENSPKLLKHIKKFNKALDAVESSLDLRKPLLTNGALSNSQTPRLDKENYLTEYSSPVPSGRKSILKTPGTAKSRMRNVIFNEKLRVKKYNFLITDDGETPHVADAENDESTEEDLAKSLNDEAEKGDITQRTLTLRNRKVQLRPSCEIFVPFK
ncbi:hypothetical protein DOY81_009022 [Sarcophaga bullata]|nr:hypothetical protein DOY81_009022 [Sarcophaga bullata]